MTNEEIQNKFGTGGYYDLKKIIVQIYLWIVVVFFWERKRVCSWTRLNSAIRFAQFEGPGVNETQQKQNEESCKLRKSV